MKPIFSKIFWFAVLFVSCSKKSISNIAPANLSVTVNVSSDSSGNVRFMATADYATEYEFDFGDGSYKLLSSGDVNHRYSSSGAFTVRVTARNSSGQSITKTVPVNVVRVYRLVWSDEFDVSGAPDASKWGYDIGTGSGGWGNNELQYYTDRPVNVLVSNGVLKINAFRENYNGSSFTSSRLLTKDKFSFKYGKIEVRAKLPSGVGTWPAIWMLGSNISTVSWPACGEIDIMEHRGSEPNKIYSTVHYPGRSGSGAVGASIMASNVTDSFHVYSALWNESAISFYMDNREIFTLPNSSSLPFNQNFFIILNLAIGGNFGGSVDPNLTAASIEFDYVKVYD